MGNRVGSSRFHNGPPISIAIRINLYDGLSRSRSLQPAPGFDEADDAVEVLSTQIDKLLPADLSDDAKRRAFQLLWETWDDAEFLEKTARDIEILRNE